MAKKTDYEKAREILASYVKWGELGNDDLWAFNKAIQALDDCIEMGLKGED